MAYIEKYLGKSSDYLYAVFRIGLGALFIMLGLQKTFGLWGMPGGPAILGTLIWFAGVFEILIGLGLVSGVLVRLAGFFGVIMMIVAYYIGHVTAGGWNPAANLGAPAIAFGLAFLVCFAYGARKLSLERQVLGKELF